MAHKDLSSGEIHRIHDKEYADKAALLAATTASADIGKVYKVLDEDAYYTVKTAGSPGTFLRGGKEFALTSTTDGTATVAYRFNMSDNSRIILESKILAMETDGSNGNAYKVRGLFKRKSAGSATQQGTTVVVWTEEEDAAWSVEYDTDGNNVRLRVTGAAATNITWITETELTHVI